MEKLYEKLKNYTLKDALKFEKNDRQFKALQKLGKHFENKKDSHIKNENNIEIFLALIISNALICYQLSGTGENYWEEFSEYFSKKDFVFEDVIKELSDFIKQSKNNKRFVDAKIQRLEKIKPFLNNFKGEAENYYNDMVKLRDDLANVMQQKPDTKTIVFAVKMFYYGAKTIFGDKVFPNEIFIPIDSRLTNIFEKYKEDYTDINKFYIDLSEKLNIPMLHLDSILWVSYGTGKI